VQRLETASVATTPNTAPPINAELAALHLVSTAPADFGLGTGTYFITLQKERGGPSSTGNLTITFDTPAGGTFSSFFDVFFDIRLGSLDGPIAFSSDLTLTQTGAPWSRIPPDGATTIPGVNLNLNGRDNSSDFWPGTIPGLPGQGRPFTEQHPGQGVHTVVAGTPEPGPIALLCSLVVSGAIGVIRRRKTNR
jgi:hypothetical protein